MYPRGQIRRPHFDATQEPELHLCKKQFWRITGIYTSARGLIGSERICYLESRTHHWEGGWALCVWLWVVWRSAEIGKRAGVDKMKLLLLHVFPGQKANSNCNDYGHHSTLLMIVRILHFPNTDTYPRRALLLYPFLPYLLSYFGERASQVYIVEQRLASEYSDVELVRRAVRLRNLYQCKHDILLSRCPLLSCINLKIARMCLAWLNPHLNSPLSCDI